jgi:hypothetical protein
MMNQSISFFMFLLQMKEKNADTGEGATVESEGRL